MTQPDLSRVWFDAGWWVHPNGMSRLLSWNAATKELAFWPGHRFEHPIVLARIETEDEVRGRLDGYADLGDDNEAPVWLAGRLDGLLTDSGRAWLNRWLEECR